MPASPQTSSESCRCPVGRGPGLPVSGVEAVVLVAVLLAGCGRPPTDGSESSRSTSNPAMAPLDYLSAQGQGKRHSENVVALAQVRKALQEFQVTENRWPTDLGELVRAGLLAAVPNMPSGQRLAYDPASGTVTVVSVGR